MGSLAKDYERAIDDYTKATELDPKFAEAYERRGGVYLQKRDYSRAIADLNKALELNTKFAAAYLQRGRAYRKRPGKAAL